MTLSEQDIESRKPIWNQLQMVFMDIDPELYFVGMAETCAKSNYSVEELKEIYFREVFPACRFNMVGAAPEWTGFDIEWLAKRILKMQRHGKLVPFLGRSYASGWWRRLEPEIRRLRPNLASTS